MAKRLQSCPLALAGAEWNLSNFALVVSFSDLHCPSGQSKDVCIRQEEM